MYQIYGFDWCKSNHLNLQFKMIKIKTSPLVTNSYSLSGENSIRRKLDLSYILQERNNRVSCRANLHI